MASLRGEARQLGRDSGLAANLLLIRMLVSELVQALVLRTKDMKYMLVDGKQILSVFL